MCAVIGRCPWSLGVNKYGFYCLIQHGAQATLFVCLFAWFFSVKCIKNNLIFGVSILLKIAKIVCSWDIPHTTFRRHMWSTTDHGASLLRTLPEVPLEALILQGHCKLFGDFLLQHQLRKKKVHQNKCKTKGVIKSWPTAVRLACSQALVFGFRLTAPFRAQPPITRSAAETEKRYWNPLFNATHFQQNFVKKKKRLRNRGSHFW